MNHSSRSLLRARNRVARWGLGAVALLISGCTVAPSVSGGPAPLSPSAETSPESLAPTAVASPSPPVVAPLGPLLGTSASCIEAKQGERFLWGIYFRNESSIEVTLADISVTSSNVDELQVLVDPDDGMSSDGTMLGHFPSDEPDEPDGWDEERLAASGVDPDGAVIRGGAKATILMVFTVGDAKAEPSIGPLEVRYDGAGQSWTLPFAETMRITETLKDCGRDDVDDDGLTDE